MEYQYQLDAANTPFQSRCQDLSTLDSPAQNAVVVLRSVQRRTTNMVLEWSSYGMLGDSCRMRRELLTLAHIFAMILSLRPLPSEPQK